MPSSIPYDHPSLVLGNVINPQILAKLKQISSLQSKIDAAQDKMNSHVALKRSIGMTVNEMLDMNVDAKALIEKVKEIDDTIIKAAADYAAARLTNENAIQAIKEEMAEMEADEALESPVDFGATQVQKLPLSAESLKLDAQYFSYDENNSGGSTGVIENYIKESTSAIGNKASSDIAKAASAQINLQQKNHRLSGTLIITASCTHKNVSMLSPCVIDVDKAVSVWNRIFPDDKISTADKKSVQQVADQEESRDSKSISILSGAAYGSSFVGMVHLLKQDVGPSSLSLLALAGSLQERMTVGKWFTENSGGFGIDSTMADDIKNLLSTQRITAHITVVVMGATPSIKSNQLQMGVKGLTEFDFGKIASGISSISNITSSEKKTVEQAADAAKTGSRVFAMQGSIIQSIMSGLGTIDQGANKTMDINSMMTAFEDFLQEAKKGESGVPVHFYLKTLTQQQIARLWSQKYYPDEENLNLSVPTTRQDATDNE